ncbi:hypothetical protein PCE1_000482 [Barthelona sp. PCE]
MRDMRVKFPRDPVFRSTNEIIQLADTNFEEHRECYTPLLSSHFEISYSQSKPDFQFDVRAAVDGLWGNGTWVQPKPPYDPFLVPESELFLDIPLIENVEPSHEYYCLMNKYPACPRHFLLLTSDFMPQFLPPNEVELRMLHAFTRHPEYVGFINIGCESGASQPHRHFQLINTEVFGNIEHVPIDMALRTWDRELVQGSVEKCTELQFLHCFVDIRDMSIDDIITNYHIMMDSVGLPSTWDAYNEIITPPNIEHTWLNYNFKIYKYVNVPSYNFIMTGEFMLVVPRTSAKSSVCPMNSLPFLGSFFTRDREQNEAMRFRVASELLAEGCPKDLDSYQAPAIEFNNVEMVAVC